MIYNGGCYCGSIWYEINLPSPDEARTSLCHCRNCRKFTGSENGITTKIPLSSFHVTKGKTKVHKADNGRVVQLTREFCADCGSGILEFGANAGDNRYIFWGTLDEPYKDLDPKGEFYCKYRAGWMPEIPGLFHKKEIKE